MPSIQDLLPFITEPREDLGVEYKTWLNLSGNEHKATIAKAAIALANHGGGFIIIGFEERGQELYSIACPDDMQEITQDLINAAIRRFAAPEFHCEMYNITNPTSGIVHPVICIPGTQTEPVMSKRDCQDTLVKNRCYIRKPGPRSEEPHTGDEWRALLNRCIRAGRDDMLEAIRSIVTGRVEVQNPTPNALDDLKLYSEAAYDRWQELVSNEPADSPSKFPNGFYEMSFSLVGANQATGLSDLQNKLANARQIKLTGWTPFLALATEGWAPYPHEDFIEAWVGRPVRENWENREPSFCDFWRVSTDGKLYTIRGYSEDGQERLVAGETFDVSLPVLRIGEGLLFAARLADTFEGVNEIVIQCHYKGLGGRRLISFGGRRALFSEDTCRTDEVILTSLATPEQVQDNLAEIIHQLLLPLYEKFNFFKLPISLVDEELIRLRIRQ